MTDTTEPKAVSTLAYALLGLLAREPCSGYDLTQRLTIQVGAFWHARHSQIYPELASLEARALVTHELIAQSTRPDKKLYAITDAGHAALRGWVDAPSEVPQRRDEFVLKAFSLWLAEPQQALAQLRAHARQHSVRQAHYEHIMTLKMSTAGAVPPCGTPLFASYVVLQRGIGYEREYAAWCNWVADLLEQQSSATPTEPHSVRV